MPDRKDDPILIDVAETLRPTRPMLTREELLRLAASLREPAPTLAKTPTETILSLLGASGHATAKALGAAIDKPGDARSQLAEFGKGLLEAPTLKPGDQSTPSAELERRTGQPEPGLMKLVDAVLDVGNLVQPENLALKAAGVVPIVAAGRKVLARADDLGRLTGNPAKVLATGHDVTSLAESLGLRTAGETGAISPSAALTLGGGTLDAVGGAAVNEDDRLTGAVIGGLGGAVAGAGASKALRAGRVVDVAQEAAETVPEATDDAVRVGVRVPGLGAVQDAIANGGIVDEPAVSMTRSTPTTGQLSADDARVAAFVDRHAGLTPEDTKEIKDILLTSDHAWDHRRMGMTWEQQQTLSRDIDIRIDLPKGTALNAEEMGALRSKAVGLMAKARAVNEDLIDIAKTDDAGLAELEQRYGVTGRQGLAALRETEWLKAKAALQSMMGARSEAARTLNSLRDVQRARETGDDAFITKALKDGASFEDAFRASMSLGTDLEKYKFLRSLAKPGAQDYWRWYYISNLLSGPLTHARNALGNASNLALDMVSAPVAAAFSKEASAGEALAQFPGLWTGVKDGLQKAVFAFKNGFSLDDVSTMRAGSHDRAPEVFGGKMLPNVVSRTLEATDQFFRGVAFQTELSRAAYTQAYKQGLRGKPLWTEVARITGDPDVNLVKSAKTYADRAVFRQAGGEGTKAIRQVIRSLDDQTVKLSDALSKAAPSVFDNRIARGLLQVPAGTFVMPFISTPINIWRAGMELTPYGVGKGLVQGGREGAQVAARGAVGTSLLGIAAMWAAEGNMTGAAPTDPQERDKFYADGKIPNAVKIGDRWVSYQMLGGPLAMPLSLVANAFDVYRQTGEVKAGEVIAKVGNSLLDQSYLSGMMGLIEAVSRADTHGERWAGRMASGLIPAAGAVRAVRSVTDPVIRDADTISEHVQSNIPGLSSSLPARIDYAGKTITRRGGIAGALINPVDSSASSPDATREAMTDVGAYYSDPTRAALNFAKRLDKAGITLTGQERLRYAQQYGQTSANVMKAVIADARFRDAPPEARAKMIERVRDLIGEQAQRAFLAQLAIDRRRAGQ